MQEDPNDQAANAETQPLRPAGSERPPGSQRPAGSERPAESMAEDRIVTPQYLPAVPAARPPRPSTGLRLLSIAALVMSAAALLLAVVMLLGLLRARNTMVTTLDNSISQLQGVCGPGAQPVTFPFSQTIRFQGSVPVPAGIVIPFKGTIPINTTIRMVLNSIPGSPVIEVPVNTTVPVDTQVPLPGGIKIPIDTEVPVRQTIPVDICGPGSPAAGAIDQGLRQLRELRQSLDLP